MMKFIKYFSIILLIGTLLISSYILIKNKKEDIKQEEIFEEIIEIADSTDKEDKENEYKNKKNNKSNNENKEQSKLKTRKGKINLSKLYEINNDIVGWIRIDKSNINYPVMQRKSNPNYYLRRNFYKGYSYYGTPFLARSCDIEKSDNLIIYGHHIRGNRMFGELEKYRSKQYYNEHKKIRLYTMQGEKEYEIMSVFQTVAYTGFEYYYFMNDESKEDYEKFIKKCKELSFYNTEVTASYGDKFITLSTCDYRNKNGRFAVIGKEIQK